MPPKQNNWNAPNWAMIQAARARQGQPREREEEDPMAREEDNPVARPVNEAQNIHRLPHAPANIQPRAIGNVGPNRARVRNRIVRDAGAPNVPPQPQHPARPLQDPRGRIRGLNGHYLQAVAWVFTLRLQDQNQLAVNYIDPDAPSELDYRIPTLERLQARFEDPFHAPPGSPPVYISYQLELGNNNDLIFGDNYHIQGYFEFQHAVNAIQIVEIMGWNNWDLRDVYLAPRVATQEQAARYTRKDDDTVVLVQRQAQQNGNDDDDDEQQPMLEPRLRVEEGAMRNQDGNDVWNVMRQMVRDGASYNDIMDAYPRQALVMASGLSKAIMERLKQDPPRWRDVKVYVLWGDSRTGKSRKVYELEGDKVYSKQDDNAYFDGYDPAKHEALLLDECVGYFKLPQMLKWLDGYPVMLNQKFGGAYANWKRVYILSNVPPREWYPNASRAQLNALYKRYNSGGIVKYVDTNDAESMQRHADEVLGKSYELDRPYVIFNGAPK